MATTATTTAQLADNIVAQVESTTGQTVPWLPKMFTRVFAKALAGVFILLYRYIGFGILQGFVRTASATATVVNGKAVIPLNEWGELVGAGPPGAAVQAELKITVEKESLSLDLSVPSGAQLIYAPSGVTYLTIEPLFVPAGATPSGEVIVRASADQQGGNGAGAIGNLTAGQVLQFANNLSNARQDAGVVSAEVTGANAEGVEVYRQRVLDRFRQRPQGGALADYKAWGEEPTGIINVYPYRADCPGQVDVYVEATPESSGSADGIPTQAQLETVLESINRGSGGLATRAPVGALPNTLPISRSAFDVNVSGLSVPNTAETQAQILDATEEYFLAREPYLPGLSVPPRLDQVTNTALGGIIQNIVSANGGTFAGVTIQRNSVVVLFYTLGQGEKSKLGALSYI